MVHAVKAQIMIPPEVHVIAECLGDAELYVVGGFVRDHLYHRYHCDRSKPYTAKDVDLATNLSEGEILAKLRSEFARNRGVRVKEKESVDTFGVVFASVGGSPTLEVAPFRRDVGSADGRRPERVERGTIAEDAARRDLTVNSLYYDFVNGLILDFNDGQGIMDVQNKRVRTVGDPDVRFDEDRLRVLRLVRFFSRYNGGRIVDHLDRRTIDAVRHYSALEGISPERIQSEFSAGLVQSASTSAYLINYADMRLFPAVFPGIGVKEYDTEGLGNTKSVEAVLAYILSDSSLVGDSTRDALNGLKWPNEVADAVGFLKEAMWFDSTNAIDVVKARDRRLVKGKDLADEVVATNEVQAAKIRSDLLLMADLTGGDQSFRMRHLADYRLPAHPTGEELMAAGFFGKGIGDEQRRLFGLDYERDWLEWSDYS